MSIEIEFAGAAREVTGSCHIVRAAGRTVMLDCGLFQGRRADSAAKNRALRVELRQWIDELRAQSPSLGPIWLVRGEASAQDALADALAADHLQVSTPEPGSRHTW